MHLRFFLSALFLLAWTGCATHRALSAFTAGQASARLANDRCYREFGKRPFAADDFDAVFDQGRWHWGGPESNAVDGFRAEVVLGPYGEKKEVAVTGAEEK
jgi:hypothetical protein